MTNWYPLATVHAGPAWKQYGGVNPIRGVVCHSAEGYRAGLLAEIANPSRRSAWTFSVMKDGDVFQHYALNAILAHAADWGGDGDGANGNGELVSIEHEGVAGEPLTPAQRDASVALVNWIASQGGWAPSRTTKKTLWEHRELSDTGTSCPSDRIPWAYYVVKEVPKVALPPLKLNEWVQKVYGPSTVPGRPPWNKHVRTEDLGNGYVDDVYEMRVRRKVN